MRALAIGGPYDGNYYESDRDTLYLGEVLSRTPQHTIVSDLPPYELPKIETYYLRRLIADDKSIVHVWMYEGLSETAAIEMLISGYRSP